MKYYLHIIHPAKESVGIVFRYNIVQNNDSDENIILYSSNSKIETKMYLDILGFEFKSYHIYSGGSIARVYNY